MAWVTTRITASNQILADSAIQEVDVAETSRTTLPRILANAEVSRQQSRGSFLTTAVAGFAPSFVLERQRMGSIDV